MHAKRVLGDLGVGLGGARDGVAKEREALAAVVAHSNAWGGGHACVCVWGGAVGKVCVCVRVCWA